MTPTNSGAGICSIARTLAWVGEPWTLLIVREAFFGTQQFTGFEQNLGVAKNVLSNRLRKLVEVGILTCTPVPGRGNPKRYTLTDRGRDLFPVLIALMQWGDRWINRSKGAPVQVLNRKTLEGVAPLLVRDPKGQALSMSEVLITAGPGANAAVRRRLGRPLPGTLTFFEDR